jgi:DNA polymerase I-like protein with 3'-5' exonuclease and polymerase domains
MLRAFFSAPLRRRLLNADYSAIEFRVAAWVAGEGSIIQRYRDCPTFDPHTWVTAQFYGIPESEVTKEQRQVFKSYNFGLLYMAQPKTVQEYIFKTTGLEISLEEAERGHKFWHGQFPAFRRWYAQTWEELKAYGYVESATGRRRHFVDEVIYQPRWKRAADLREAVNFKVQSLAADIALTALARCHQVGLPINGFVHDSISFEIGDNEDLTEWITQCMVEYPVNYLRENFGVNFTMPLAVEIK